MFNNESEAKGLPLVSILTPSFNQGRWLSDNLRSVACQTYPHTEQIVMDGGSTDETLDILRNASERVTWRSEPDRGISHALNKALAQSEGDIIGWLSSDDAYFSTDAIASAVQLFEREPDIDVVYGHAALVNGDGLILHLIWVPPFSYRLLHLHNFIIAPSAFIRRSALDTLIADEAYDLAMDRELWLRLGRDHRFAMVNKVLAIDRHHRQRKTATRPDLAHADNKRIVAAYGAPNGWWTLPARKALKIVFRLMGLGILSQAAGPLAFEGLRDGLRSLAVRQIAVRRATMPAGTMLEPQPGRSPS